MNFCPTCAKPLETRLVDGTERRACDPSCGFVHWNNPVPVAAALVRTEKGFVLARNAGWPAGIFSLITGFLETGERPEETIVRETKEELCLDAEHVEFVGWYPFARMNQIIMAYYVEASGPITLDPELAEYKYVSTDELADYDFGPAKLGTLVVRDWFRLESSR